MSSAEGVSQCGLYLILKVLFVTGVYGFLHEFYEVTLHAIKVAIYELLRLLPQRLHSTSIRLQLSIEDSTSYQLRTCYITELRLQNCGSCKIHRKNWIRLTKMKFRWSAKETGVSSPKGQKKAGKENKIE